MQISTSDPIVSEVRAAREQHAAQFGYDLREIFRDIKAKQEASDHKFVRYPSRPAAQSPSTMANKDE